MIVEEWQSTILQGQIQTGQDKEGRNIEDIEKVEEVEDPM